MEVSSSYFDMPMSLYLAHLSSVGQTDLSEGIDGLQQFTVEAFEKAVRDDQITDSHALCAFLKARILGLL